MTSTDKEFVVEVLKACLSEFEAMEDTYDDYCVTGPLLNDIEEAIALLEEERG